MARPSEFNQETADSICEQLIEGKSLRSLCREESMPAASTVCRWLSQNEEFRKQYAHARELQADSLFDESLDIADNAHDSQAGCDPDVQRDRLRIDTRKWMASKLAARKYGDKIDVTSNGETVGRIVYPGLDD